MFASAFAKKRSHERGEGEEEDEDEDEKEFESAVVVCPARDAA